MRRVIGPGTATEIWCFGMGESRSVRFRSCDDACRLVNISYLMQVALGRQE